MKKTSALLAAIGIVAATTMAAYADSQPYFGTEPYNGSYWNGPDADFPASAFGYRENGSACRYVRARHVRPDGSTGYRLEQICY